MVDDGPPWVRAALTRAVEIWAQHGVQVVPGATGIVIEVGIPADEPVADARSLYRYRDVIYLAERLESQEVERVACSLSHEIGHAIGMEHVASTPRSMLSPSTTVADGVCLWSELDAAELARVRSK